jgi:hypothetical protein
MVRAQKRTKGTLAASATLLLAVAAQGAGDNMANTLTAAEKKDGWELLFDGKSLDAWRGYKMQTLPVGWTVKDGAIHFMPQPLDAPATGQRQDIITRKQYQDFELVVEWAVTPAGNSGIFFHVAETGARTYETGPEFQVLDNKGHKDGEKPVTSAGSNYALHAPVKDVTKPLGEWNEARITVKGAHVTHFLNGTKLLEYDLWTPEWKAMVEASKFKAMPGYGLEKTGHIALQDHGDHVMFRNIKIRSL